MNIYLIAGHGNGDPGAVGNGFKEAVLTREVCQNIKKYMDELGVSCTVLDTGRNWFEYLKTHSYSFKGADFVLEVHFNSATSAQAHGVEIYHPDGVADTKIHTNIVNALSKNIGFYNRGVKKYNYSVINKIAKQGIKCGLLEVCFISNVDNMLRYSQNRDKVGITIAESMTGKKVGENMNIAKLENNIKALQSENERLKSRVAVLEKYADTKVYNYIDENMPEAYQATIKKLVRQNIIKGTNNGLELSDRMCRLLVYLDRAGIFNGFFL